MIDQEESVRVLTKALELFRSQEKPGHPTPQQVLDRRALEDLIGYHARGGGVICPECGEWEVGDKW